MARFAWVITRIIDKQTHQVTSEQIQSRRKRGSRNTDADVTSQASRYIRNSAARVDPTPAEEQVLGCNLEHGLNAPNFDFSKYSEISLIRNLR